MTLSKSSFFLTERNSRACVLSIGRHYSDGDTGSRVCARPRPKGLPYIIHYALAHQASLSGVTPRGLSSLACHLVANCWSKGDKSRSPPLHALIALRERGGGGRAPFWLGGTLILVAERLCGRFWHRMSRAELNGVSVSSVSFQLLQRPAASRSFLMHSFTKQGNS